MSVSQITRREFMRRGAGLGIAGVAAPWALNLAALGEAAGATVNGDYRALVCVFLAGGNDQDNTLIPYDSASYAEYARIRPALATPRSALDATALMPISALGDANRQMALAPQLAPLKVLFDAGRMAVLLNVGALLQPTTVAQYAARSAPLPPKLFSHADQQSFWQSSLPEGAVSGWGGRIGDLFLSSNGTSTFTCINVSGNAVFMAGQAAVQFQIGADGAVVLRGIESPLYGSPACSTALQRLITADDNSHPMQFEHARVMRRALEANARLGGLPVLATEFDSRNPLARQLRMVARLIAARGQLGARRQVFYVSLGGFDTHDSLTTKHPGLLAWVADAISSFHAATLELGVADSVTTFTASEFGRTLTSNGDGSDHGWGGHHFVIGGAVRGQRYFGKLPALAANGPDDVGQGRLLPTTSVDQLAATLASWMGVTAGELPLVAPNIGNFTEKNLGFLLP